MSIKIELDLQFVQELVNYLQTKPFLEVHQFIAKLIQAAQEKNGPKTE